MDSINSILQQMKQLKEPDMEHGGKLREGHIEPPIQVSRKLRGKVRQPQENRSKFGEERPRDNIRIGSTK